MTEWEAVTLTETIEMYGKDLLHRGDRCTSFLDAFFFYFHRCWYTFFKLAKAVCLFPGRKPACDDAHSERNIFNLYFLLH